MTARVVETIGLTAPLAGNPAGVDPAGGEPAGGGPTTRAPLFRVEQVWVHRPGNRSGAGPILQGVTADIGTGGITCVVGPSGGGKSTLLRLLNRLQDPDRGRVLFRGRDLRGYDPLWLRRQVGMVFQAPVMLPGTVRDNLEAGLRLQGRTLADPGAWLERVGLDPALLGRPAAELSGGEQQRVALVRTLALAPAVLLLDEVTSALDAGSTAAIERLVLGLQVPVVWVSHDMAQVRRVAARVLQVAGGRVTEGMPE